MDSFFCQPLQPLQSPEPGLQSVGKFKSFKNGLIFSEQILLTLYIFDQGEIIHGLSCFVIAASSGVVSLGFNCLGSYLISIKCVMSTWRFISLLKVFLTLKC